jgi:putative DNA primase/helicase
MDNVTYFDDLKKRFKDDPSYISHLSQDEDYPDKSGKKILDTYGNFEYLANKLGMDIRWNVMKRTREITIPGVNIFLDDHENSALAHIINCAILNGMPIKLIDSHIDIMAQKNAYHPIVELMKNNPWDQTPRLDRFIKTLKTLNDDLSYRLIRKWMVGAVAAAHSIEGIALHGALVLQGKQYIGKTQWVKRLDPIGCKAVMAGSLLDPTNKDCLIALAQYWIVELGELDGTFNKSDIARIKGYITNDCDVVRAAWARKSTRLLRRSTFVATVNESKYLVDTNGNRRWWTIPVLSIDLEHGLDMTQVWAEVFYYWKNGEGFNLLQSDQDALNELNVEHQQIDPFKEKLLTWYDWSSPARKELTATDVLEEMGYTKPSRGDATNVGKLLQEINNSPGRKSNGVKLHRVPLKILFRNRGT